jgi:catechol 2,3-dioxygenase-like lactoylglutathione lyase family enzyme
MTMQIVGIDHVQVAMPSGGEDLARAFYTGILGLPEIPKPIQIRHRGGVWFQCAGMQIHLGVEQEFRPARKAHPAFRVEQLDALLEKLDASGFDVVHDESLPDVRRAFTSDPFGNRIELIASLAPLP